MRPSDAHDLMPGLIAKDIPPLYATDGKDPLVLVKWFDPCGRWTYYVVEYDPEERLVFGFCRSPLGGDLDELGYASLDEIRATRNRMGLPMERDLHWKPVPLSKVREGEG